MGANVSHETLGPDDHASKPHSSGSVFNPYGRASLRKSLRRRKSKRKHKKNTDALAGGTSQVDGQSNEAHLRRMDKLKKSLRESFRKKKEGTIPEASKPHLWHSDESDVRDGTCSFHVKYLGCVEVFESRGMPVCEEALKVLRGSRRRPIRGILYVSGDGLRVVEDETKGLLVDQTIEKVSFCAPDRNHERGFSYICRDGTTRRWMCHGFIAIGDTGERLSHAVGCAFAACLERKQKRDTECNVTMTFDRDTSAFTRMGSFRQLTVTERLNDPQECKPIVDPVPVKKVDNPHAIARPHATPQLLQRQGSFRVFTHLNESSPFKRQLSLRITDLPSNMERTRSMSLDAGGGAPNEYLNRLNNNVPITVAPIPEASILDETSNNQQMTSSTKADAVSAMCQQVSAGLSLLSGDFADELQRGADTGYNRSGDVDNRFADTANRYADTGNALSDTGDRFADTGSRYADTGDRLADTVSRPADLVGRFADTGIALADTFRDNASSDLMDPAPGAAPAVAPPGANVNPSDNAKSKAEEWIAQINSGPSASTQRRYPHLSQLRSSSLDSQQVSNQNFSRRPTTSNVASPLSNGSGVFSAARTGVLSPGVVGVGGNASGVGVQKGGGVLSTGVGAGFGVQKDALPPRRTAAMAVDPFDAEWATSTVSHASHASHSDPNSSHNTNNPFLQNSVTKTFQIQM